MYIVYPPELNTPELCVIAKGGRLGFKFTGRPHEMGSGWAGIAHVCSDVGGHYASANIGLFTGNCGMRTISGVWALGGDKLSKVFLSLIESWMMGGHYSYLIGSDGQSSGWKMLSFIEAVGDNWTVVPLKKNQRMSETTEKPMKLFYKYLDWTKNPFPKINWAADGIPC